MCLLALVCALSLCATVFVPVSAYLLRVCVCLFFFECVLACAVIRARGHGAAVSSDPDDPRLHRSGGNAAARRSPPDHGPVPLQAPQDASDPPHPRGAQDIFIHQANPGG